MTNFYDDWITLSASLEDAAAKAPIVARGSDLRWVETRQDARTAMLIGHRSAQASHLGNISYMQKRRIDFDPVREEILPF